MVIDFPSSRFKISTSIVLLFFPKKESINNGLTIFQSVITYYQSKKSLINNRMMLNMVQCQIF